MLFYNTIFREKKKLRFYLFFYSWVFNVCLMLRTQNDLSILILLADLEPDGVGVQRDQRQPVHQEPVPTSPNRPLAI